MTPDGIIGAFVLGALVGLFQRILFQVTERG